MLACHGTEWSKRAHTTYHSNSIKILAFPAADVFRGRAPGKAVSDWLPSQMTRKLDADWTRKPRDWYLNCSLKIRHVFAGISGTFRVCVCVGATLVNTWSKPVTLD